MGRAKIDRTGEETYNNFGSKMIIVNQYRYNNVTYIDVYFPEYNWTCEQVEYGNFKKGNIKCVYERRTYGIGYLGEGKYKPRENGKKTKCYETWHSMLQRCYDDKYQEKYPTYKGCEVCEEWHNFQNFAEWFENNYYEIPNEKMCLDKDILLHGNKIYSRDTCLIVPHRINLLFTYKRNNKLKLPSGVSPHRSKYQVMCSDGSGKQIALGIYETINEAFTIYKEFKERIIKQVADEYYSKSLIPKKVQDALYKYEVLITD